jgi:hypothetical protein
MTHKHLWQYNDVLVPGVFHRACVCGVVQHMVIGDKVWSECSHFTDDAYAENYDPRDDMSPGSIK